MRLPRLSREVINLGGAFLVYIIMGGFGWWMWGNPAGVYIWHVFALSGISGIFLGYWVGGGPVRQLRRDWEDHLRKPRNAQLREFIKEMDL